MRLRSAIFAAMTTIGLSAAGCVGDLEQTTPGDNSQATPATPATPGGTPAAPTGDLAADAKADFTANVFTVMQGCGGPTCHSGVGGAVSPNFVYDDVDTTYDAVRGFNTMVGTFNKASAPMYTLLQAGAIHSGGPFRSPADDAAVAKWLDMELAAVAIAGGDPTNPAAPSAGSVSAQLQGEWSGCMNLEEWNQLNVAEEWANKNSQTGICRACHNTGADGFIASEDSLLVFDLVTTNEVFQLSYFKPQLVNPENPQDPAFVPQMVINYDRFNAVRQAEFPHINHGRFNLNQDDDAVQALEAFYEATMARKAAGQCEPSRIAPQTPPPAAPAP